jgi:hypothetical protein
VTSPDPLDLVRREAPSLQGTIDIFRGAWSSKFPDRYQVHAGQAELFDDGRVRWAIEQLGTVRGYRILELGPLEGAHSYMLERAGAASIVGVEACVLSFLKCLVVKELLGFERVAFRFGNFMEYLAGATDEFDLIFASGVLYHQANPVLCIKRIAEHTDRAFIWTHYYTAALASEHITADLFGPPIALEVDGFACDAYPIAYDSYLKNVKYRGGVDDSACWMRKADLLHCLEHFGLSHIQIGSDCLDHPYGPNLALLARRPRD